MKAQKLLFCFLIIAINFSSFQSLNAQDLIERTKLQLKPEKTRKVNEIAKFVAKNWKESTARNEEYNIFGFNDQPAHASLTSVVTEAVYLDLKEEDLSNLINTRPSQMSFAIPVNQKSSIILDLVEVENVASDFKITMSDGSNPPSMDQAIFYRGIVRGNTNSWAAITVFENDIFGVIADNGGNYVLGKLDGFDQFTLYNDQNFIENMPFTCQYNDNASPANEISKLAETPPSPSQLAGICVQIYIEIDYFSYGQLGSDATAVMNFVVGAFNGVTTIYANEQISIEMSELKIWNTPDSYGYSGTNCGTVLNNFRAAQGSSFNGNLAHLITTRPNNSGACGLASINCSCGPTPSVCNQPVWCASNAHGYSQTYDVYQNYPTFSWTVEVLSHEMGHNFGSPHTQACAWNGNNTAIDGCVAIEQQRLLSSAHCNFTTSPLTNCGIPSPQLPVGGGTIMSYCHQNGGSYINFVNGFGSGAGTPGDLIRANVAASAGCLTTACTASDLGDGVCRSSMMVTDNDIPGSTGNFRSASTITTNGTVTVANSQTVNFLATTSVTLESGFTAEVGSIFTAKIETCTASLQSSEDNISKYLASITTENNPISATKTEMFEIVPNPFTNTTKIKFYLEESTTISIHIYDLSGHLLEAVLSEDKIGKGYNEMDYHAHNLPTGMYYMMMSKNGVITAQKMAVMNSL